MHSQSAVRVYVDAGGEATLVAYRKLHTRYLVLLYTQSRAWYTVASFDQILDTVPIRAAPLPDVDLSLDTTVEGTLRSWLHSVRRALQASEPDQA